MKRINPTRTQDSSKKKLELERESIRPLSEDKLEEVVGGGITTATSRPRCAY